jgi:hypothetical protein
VDGLARRIASFPADAVRLAKQSVDNARLPIAEGCERESALFQTLLFSDPARHAMRRFLELGGQTREGELRVAEISAAVAGV